ncbi:MAG: hypothetical protein ACI4AM_07230 [Muribaculaceae bacterium]
MKSLINSILLSLAVAICLIIGACAERQPGQAQNHIGGAVIQPEQTEHSQKENNHAAQAGSSDQNVDEAPDNNDTAAGADKGTVNQPADAATNVPKATPMDTLRKDLSAVQYTIKELPTDVKQLKEEASTNYLYVIITFIVAVIGLAIAIINFVNIREQHKRLDRHRDHINQLAAQFQLYSQDYNQQATGNKYTISQTITELQQLRQRVAMLENKLVAVNRVPQQVAVAAVVQQQPTQHSFFPAPAMSAQGAYFPKQLSSRESALFEASIRGSKAEFTPCVSFQNIISIDALRNAIEFQGVSKSEAKNMVISANGQAELRNNKWCILRKVTIYLTK